jgi:hypothetical protein
MELVKNTEDKVKDELYALKETQETTFIWWW